MKKNLFLILFLLHLTTLASGQRKVENEAFSVGEKLNFKVAFSSLLTGSVTAGNATIEVLPGKTSDTWHIAAKGGTSGFIEFFFKINYQFDSFINNESLLPLVFYSKKRENRYRKSDTIYFNHNQRIAKSGSNKTRIPVNSQDVLSALYFARTMDITNLKKGNYLEVPFFMEDSVYYSRIVFQGRETIKTKKGKVNCVVFKPMVATGRVFDTDFPVTMWLTDDKRKIPMLVEIKLSVGKVKVENIN